MGKKPVIGLAGLFLAGVAITATGCGQCTSCNTRPDKLRPTPMAKAPTPAGGIERKPLGELAERPAPAPMGDIMPTSGLSAPPPSPGGVGSLKRDPMSAPAASDGMPGRDPLDPGPASPRTALPVPPVPSVRSTLPSDGFPARPMGTPAELPPDTTSMPPPVSTSSMPRSAPPPPVTSTPPAPPPLPGVGSMSGDPLPPLLGQM